MSAAITMTVPALLKPLVRSIPRQGSSAEESTVLVPPPAFDIDALESLARTRPAELVHLVHAGNLDAVDLSEVAEAMRCATSHAVVPSLLRLTQHPRPVVRESALVGLAPFLSVSLEARDRLRDMAATDPSEGVKSVAQEFLKQL